MIEHRQSTHEVVRSQHPFWLLMAVAVSAAVETASAQRLADTSPGGLANGCIVREVSRRPLVVERGLELYVEPVAFAASRGRLLLAGTPNYLWQRRGSARIGLAARDSLFGAVLTRSGDARGVASPIPANLVASIRLLGRDDGKWDVVFAELERPRASIADQGTARRWWYAVFDGLAWSHLEPIPTPADARLRLLNPAGLVRFGDTLAWAAPAATETGEREVAVFERHRGRWSFQLVATYFAAYVIVATTRTHGLITLVVHGDRTLPTDDNSLFLFGRDSTWRLVRRIIQGGSEPVHLPSIVRQSGEHVLSWKTVIDTGVYRRSAARALIGGLEQPDGRLITVDSGITGFKSVVLPSVGNVVWITERVDRHNPNRRTLRYVVDGGESALLLGEYASPFLGPFAAEARAPSEIVLAGPLPGRQASDPEVVTLLIRARVQCAAKARRPT